MKYICPICGYVYDESKEELKFSELADNWVCPLCGAPKSIFKAENVSDSKPAPQLHIDAKLEDLSAGALSAVFSNLARGCEKQYKSVESELFKELSDYFAEAVPAVENASLSTLSNDVADNLNSSYPYAVSAATAKEDRGTLRITVWGEKVTRIIDSLISRYKNEGDAFIKDTHIWVCTVCGFIYVGDKSPDICPVCKVPDWKFEKIEGRRAV